MKKNRRITETLGGKEKNTMWTKRIQELIATWIIGDGVQNFIAPRSHALLWVAGPESLRRILSWFSENPRYGRFVGVAEVGFGIWLSLRQYREG